MSVNINSKNKLKRVEEDDYVEYYLFVVKSESSEYKLDDYLQNINKIVENYIENYIWHKDAFKLSVKNKTTQILDQCFIEENNSEPVLIQDHLHGLTHFGDDIDDEWFIVFLLFQISLQLNDIVVQVKDSDGEFLLIEAANHLPEWASPETCENRVYIYQGNVHIIPPNSDQSDECISTSEAIEEIISNPLSTEASSEIQRCIQDRIKCYIDISNKLHRATLYLPIAVAAILKSKPQLIAPAVLAFCNRDTIDMKACRAMRFFPPENRVYTSVLFTKHLYAMLAHSNYMPDRRTGWNLPPQTDPKFKSHNLGVRLASGFEILRSQQLQLESDADLDNNRNFQMFLGSLKRNNYFRDLIEHSNEYNSLLKQAKDYFRNISELEHTMPSTGREIYNLNQTLEYSLDDFKMTPPETDDDSWLNVSPTDIDSLLETRYGKISGNEDQQPVNLTEKLTEFMKHVSGVEGAEFPREEELHPPVRPKRGVKKNVNDKIDFDPNEFTNALQNILDLAIPDDSWDLESGSGMSDYENESEDNVTFDEQMNKYMSAMDHELAGTTIGQSFERQKNQKKEDMENFDDIEDFEPIDIDRNALKNILKSYQSQLGDAGPAENLLGPMGVKLDDLNIDSD